MLRREIKIEVEIVQMKQLQPAARHRIETFTQARRLDFGKYLLNEIERIRKERSNQSNTIN